MSFFTKCISATALLVFSAGFAFAQSPPSNDNICNARTIQWGDYQAIGSASSIPTSPVCRSVTGTNVGSTLEVGEPPVTGSGCSIPVSNSIWYKFNNVCFGYDAPGGISTRGLEQWIQNEAGTNFNSIIEVFHSLDGTCNMSGGNMVSIGCNDNPSYTWLSCGAYGGGPTTASLTLTELLVPGETYYVRVCGQSPTDVGTSVLGLGCYIQNLTATANPASPSDRVDLATYNSAAPYYTWRMHVSGSPVTSYSTTTTTSPAATFPVIPGTSYDYQVAHRCATTMINSVSSTYSAPGFTGCASPSPLFCTVLSSTSISITWPEQTGRYTAGGTLSGYIVYFRVTGTTGTRIISNPTVSCSGGQCSYTLTGLTPGTSYDMWVQVRCSPYTQLRSNTTVCSTPGASPRLANPNQVESAGVTFTNSDITYHNVSIDDLTAYGFQFPDKFDGYVDFSTGKPLYYDKEGGKLVNPENGNLTTDAGSFDLFPNPAEDMTQVVIYSTQATDVSATLTNLSGQIIQQQSMKNIENGTRLDFNTSTVPSGLYLINVRMNDKTISRKLVVMH